MQESSNGAPWFIARFGESRGPYSWSQLRSAVRQGLIRPRDWVWRPGMRRWVRAEDQAGLMTGITPPPVPAEDPPPPPEVPVLAGEGNPSAVDDAEPIEDADSLVLAEETSAGSSEGAQVLGRVQVTTAAVPTANADVSGGTPLDQSIFDDACDIMDEHPGAHPIDIDGNGSIDLTRPEPKMRPHPDGAKTGRAWLPIPSSSKTSSMGETTRQFLAAAGVSAKMRLRRQRRAAALAVASLLLLGFLGQFVWKAPPASPVAHGSSPPAIEGLDPAESDAAALERAEACKLTGDCPERRRVRSKESRGTIADLSAAERAARRDETPESVTIGALKTEGVAPAVIAPEQEVTLDVRSDVAQASLSAAQTRIVKSRVTPGLKQCGGVFAPSTVVVEFSTDAQGKVQRVRVPRGPSRVRRCLKRSAQVWRFGVQLASRRIELTVLAKNGVVRVKAKD